LEPLTATVNWATLYLDVRGRRTAISRF